MKHATRVVWVLCVAWIIFTHSMYGAGTGGTMTGNIKTASGGPYSVEADKTRNLIWVSEWMADKLASGFTLGKPAPEDPKRNEYLVPWEEVPEKIKKIDRDLIRGIPEILSRAGYTIVKIREATTE